MDHSRVGRYLEPARAIVLRLVPVAGPALLAVLVALYVGRPSTLYLAAGIALALAIVACDAWIVVRRHWLMGALALATQIAFVAFLFGYAASPLPMPSTLSGPLPDAAPPAGVAVYAIPTGANHRTAAFAYRGGSPWEKRDSVSTAVLVLHPKGDVLIDTGLGRTIASQLKETPLLFRLATDLVQTEPAADQLDRAGYDRRRLRYILLTHSHWDHASGVPDFPGVPVLITESERRFMAVGGWATAAAASIEASRLLDYGFEGGPYLGFDHSHDLYGDGSIVIVPAPGHTPGSVIVFVTLPGGARYAFVGDLVWQREALLEREGRPWLESRQLHEDRTAAEDSLLRMNAVATRYPEITIVPSHDARGYDGIPKWSPTALR